MISHDEISWSKGLIPVIEPKNVSLIVGSVSDLALIISNTGKVVGMMGNPSFRPNADLESWSGQQLQENLTPESIPKFEQRLEAFLTDKGGVLPVELNHKDNVLQTGFPMRYSFHDIGTDDTILMLGRDLRPIWEIQQQLVAAQIALEKDYETQRERDTLFRVLLASTDVATVFVSVNSGKVTECNAIAAQLFGKTERDLTASEFASEFHSGEDASLIPTLRDLAASKPPGKISLRTRNTDKEVTFSPTMFRVAGEQFLLCRLYEAGAAHSSANGYDAKPIALFESGVDAMVFVNRSGQIMSANDAFVRLSDASEPTKLQGALLADFMSRGSVDMNVIIENASRSGTMRLYATKLLTENGIEHAVEISATQISFGKEFAYALVIREARRPDVLDRGEGDVDTSSVIELIGNQSLKDIVAKTTDVVEKMCIETAVEMTSNNRVAAAEMLGVSRQSLYVKLRKYGLLKKEP